MSGVVSEKISLPNLTTPLIGELWIGVKLLSLNGTSWPRPVQARPEVVSALAGTAQLPTQRVSPGQVRQKPAKSARVGSTRRDRPGAAGPGRGLTPAGSKNPDRAHGTRDAERRCAGRAPGHPAAGRALAERRQAGLRAGLRRPRSALRPARPGQCRLCREQNGQGC
jgi:hypothetical protein